MLKWCLQKYSHKKIYLNIEEVKEGIKDYEVLKGATKRDTSVLHAIEEVKEGIKDYEVLKGAKRDTSVLHIEIDKKMVLKGTFLFCILKLIMLKGTLLFCILKLIKKWCTIKII